MLTRLAALGDLSALRALRVLHTRPLPPRLRRALARFASASRGEVVLGVPI